MSSIVGVPLVIAKEMKMPGANFEQDFSAEQEKRDAMKDSPALDAMKPRIEELERMIAEHGNHVRMKPDGSIKNDIIELAKENAELKSALKMAGEALNYIYHAIRGASEIVQRGITGDLEPKNANLREAYFGVNNALSNPVLKRLMAEEGR